MNQIDAIRLKDYISSVCKNYMFENIENLLEILLDDTFGTKTHFECIEVYYNNRFYFAYMLDNEDDEECVSAVKAPEYVEIEKDIAKKLESGIPVDFFVNMETLPINKEHMIMVNANVSMKTNDDISVTEPKVLYTQFSMRSH